MGYLEDRDVYRITEHIRSYHQLKKLYKHLYQGHYTTDDKTVWKSIKGGLKYKCKQNGLKSTCNDLIFQWRERCFFSQSTNHAKEKLKTILTNMGRTDIVKHAKGVFQDEEDDDH